MKIARPTLNKATTYERELIQRRLSRASVVKILSGCSIRKAADQLGVSKKLIEQEEERRRKSLIYPLPDDRWTLAGLLHLAYRVYQSEDDIERYALDDEEKASFDRFSEMEEELERLHHAWCEHSRTTYEYLLLDFTLQDIKAAIFKDIDKLCSLSLNDVDELIPSESALMTEDIDANTYMLNHYVWESNYSCQSKYSQVQSEIVDIIQERLEIKVEERLHKASDISAIFDLDELDITPAINPAEAFNKTLQEHDAKHSEDSEQEACTSRGKIELVKRALKQSGIYSRLSKKEVNAAMLAIVEGF